MISIFAGLPDNKITKRYRVVPGKSIHAEHGLSYYVETTIEGKTSACMFDYGLDPVGVLNNMSLLGIDVAKANAFTLSHGHFDHYMAAVEMLKQNQTRVRKGAPFYVGEEAFYHRFSLRPGTTEAADLGQLKKEEIESLGKHAQEVSGIEKLHAVMGGFHLINAKAEVIQKTVADIKVLKPDFVAPTHCTGFEAIVHFMKEMPAEFTINTAGTKYTFAV